MDTKEYNDHYFRLSEIYLSAYHNTLEPHIQIMEAMGVIVEMESELIIFEKKKGKSEKTETQQRRIDVIKKSLDAFSVASSRNLQFNLVMGKVYRDNEAQVFKIDELNKEIEKLKKQLEGI